MRAPWTPEEDAELRRHVAEGLRAPDIAERMGRTCSSIHYRKSRLGLSTMRAMPSRWTQDEVATLRRMWGSQPATAIAREMGRPWSGVVAKAIELSLARRDEYAWLATPSHIAEALGVHVRTVRNWLHAGLMRGELCYVADGRAWLVGPAEIERFCREHPTRWRPATHAYEMQRLLVRLRAHKDLARWRMGKNCVVRRRWHSMVPEHLQEEWLLLVARVAEGMQERLADALTPPDWALEHAEEARPDRHWHKWTDAEDARLRELLRRGATYAEVAADLRRPRHGVAHRSKTVVYRRSP